MRYDGATDVDDAPCGCQRVSSAISPLVLPGPEETHRAHIGFVRTVWPSRGRHYSNAVSCSLAVMDDAVDAVVVTRSLPSSRSCLAENSVKGRKVSILWTMRQRCVDEVVGEDHIDEDLGDEVSAMTLQRRVDDDVA